MSWFLFIYLIFIFFLLIKITIYDKFIWEIERYCYWLDEYFSLFVIISLESSFELEYEWEDEYNEEERSRLDIFVNSLNRVRENILDFEKRFAVRIFLMYFYLKAKYFKAA